MFSFALVLIFLPPMLVPSPNHPAAAPATQSWQIREGFIVDSHGQRVGLFGVDSARCELLR